VTVAAGATSATFTITAGTVSAATAVTLTASYAGASSMASVTVNPRLAANSQLAALSGFTTSAVTMTSGQSGTGTVTLTAAAPSGGALVKLTSSNASAVSVPANATVAAGATSATFTITAGTVGAATVVTLSATYSGVNKTASVTIEPTGKPAVALSGITLSSGTISGGRSEYARVALTGAAPAGGVVVSLSSSNPKAASVPASVTVAAGDSSATFKITAGNVNTAVPVTLTASYSGISKTASLTVDAATNQK